MDHLSGAATSPVAALLFSLRLSARAACAKFPAAMPRSPTPAAAPPRNVPPLLWPWLAFALLVFAVYLPALGGGFLWDDAGHVTRADLRSFDGLLRIWFELGATQQYYPVLHSAFWFEHLLWGDSPLGYHLVNLLQHAANACLFGLLLRRLAVPGAWLAATLFALHPVCVESVAWISEQKNTLSALFYLGAAHAWLSYEEKRHARSYALASALFVLALLTKTVTASLPAALLVVAWWRSGRIEWRRDVVPLLPWFAASLAMGLLTAQFERELIGAQGTDFSLSALERGLLACRAPWHYLVTLVWPLDLVFIYPRWPIDAAVWWQWLFPLATVAALAACVWQARLGARHWLTVALLFGGTLFPVLGFFNVYPFIFSFVADHFAYLANLALFALAGAGLSQLRERFGATRAATASLAVFGGCAVLTWQQAGQYRDLFTLYETTLARNPSSWMAHHNLAVALAEAGRPADAVPHLEAVRRLKPDYVPALVHLGDDLTRLGRADDALPVLQEAVARAPRSAEARNNLGQTLMALGRAAEGRAAFEEAVRLDPKLAVAHGNLGLALVTASHTAEALAHFERAVKLQPATAMHRVDLATCLALLGRAADSDAQFEKALALAPDNADFRVQFGHALAERGQFDRAVAQFNDALVLDSSHALAHFQLARALQRLGRVAEAREHYQTALQLDPSLRR